MRVERGRYGAQDCAQFSAKQAIYPEYEGPGVHRLVHSGGGEPPLMHAAIHTQVVSAPQSVSGSQQSCFRQTSQLSSRASGAQGSSAPVVASETSVVPIAVVVVSGVVEPPPPPEPEPVASEVVVLDEVFVEPPGFEVEEDTRLSWSPATALPVVDVAPV